MLRLAPGGRDVVSVSKRAATWGRPYDSIRTEMLRLARGGRDVVSFRRGRPHGAAPMTASDRSRWSARHLQRRTAVVVSEAGAFEPLALFVDELVDVLP